MAKRSVEYSFDIGDRVIIAAISMQGRVDSMMTSKDGDEYRVVYWNDGQRHSAWLYDWEIEPKDVEPKP